MDDRHIFIIGDEHTKFLLDSIKGSFNFRFPHYTKKIYTLPSKDISHTNDWLLEQYRAIAELIESANPIVLRNSVGIIALPFNRFEELGIHPNFLTISTQKNYDLGSFAALAGMLLMTFPEIRWIFFDFEKAKDSNKLEFIDPLKTFQTLANHNPIFDCSEYREKVRASFFSDPESSKSIHYLLDRASYSASIDEEEPYAFMHGYLAYRMGYKGFLITTKKAMDEVLSKGSDKPDINLTFEDMFLNFPDLVGNMHLSDLRKRDETYEKLKDVQKRIFVTVGHNNIGWHDDNKRYQDELKRNGKKVKVLYKPSGGIYNILEKAGLSKDYWERRKKEWEKARPSRDSENTGGHSAPGRLLAIAERLIDRAENIYNEAKSVQDCIHGATLALEAQELLGYRTPTTCLEAIALRHKLEVKAECMFYGVEYNIDVEKRFEELENEIKTVSQWFDPKVRESSALNAQMSIVTEIMRIFEEHGQFDEQQKCLNHFRRLNRRWYFKKHPWILPFKPVRWYVETLLGSFSLFIAMLFFWPIAGGILSWFGSADFGDVLKTTGSPDFGKHLINATGTFFGVQPVQFPVDNSAMIITTILILAGFLHLGIFISHLYTLISRGK